MATKISQNQYVSRDVIIEVRGGVVVEVYSDVPNLRVSIVDWDEIEDGSKPSALVNSNVAAFVEMPAETRSQLAFDSQGGA